MTALGNSSWVIGIQSTNDAMAEHFLWTMSSTVVLYPACFDKSQFKVNMMVGDEQSR